MDGAKKQSRKPERATESDKRFAHRVKARVQNTVHDAVHVLRIMVFLHSAKDFSSVLKLYEMEDSSGIE